jgi:hypothetical protein
LRAIVVNMLALLVEKILQEAGVDAIPEPTPDDIVALETCEALGYH